MPYQTRYPLHQPALVKRRNPRIYRAPRPSFLNSVRWVLSAGMKRNLKGYGSNPPNPQWPNNASIAVSFVLNYEEGGENTVLNGDSSSETFLNETPGGQPRLGVRDIAMESQYEYGSRCGLWRVMRLFAKYGFRFTCYAVGKAAEQNPAAIQAMERMGHEIASHNYRWIDYQHVAPEVERAHVRACIKSLQEASATGKAPVGWYTGRVSPNSRRIVWEEYKKLGLPLLYECDAYNDDLPYWFDMDGEGLLIIPYTLDVNDMKFSVAPGFGAPNAFFDYLKNAFDVLYAEGKDANNPSPKMMSVGLHCRLVGRPGRAAALEKFLEYVANFDDVWICTREQIANHWRDRFPFEKAIVEH